jgi:prepilin peptidase CpaA
MFWIPLGLLLLAAIFDVRRREIPDWVPALILAWSLVVTISGWPTHGWFSFGLGLLAGCGVGAALFALLKFGGGDAKTIAALGALLGAKGLLLLLYYTALAGGCLAIVIALRRQRDFAYGPAIALGYAALLAVSRGHL